MPSAGYYRYPTLHDDTIVFVSEDDLWAVPASGGVARRLTASPAQESHPALSPDGSWLAFTSWDEGVPEVHVMPAQGGPARRLTYLGADSWVVGWHPDGRSVIFASNAAQPIDRIDALYMIGVDGGQPQILPTGPAVSISFSPSRAASPGGPWTGGMVIGRHATDLARWKRYRGGLTGALWIDSDGSGEWRRLVELQGNEALPLWVGERVYFLSDHEGTANLYSCLPDGSDLRRETHHGEYYVRHPASDGRRIVYQSGADIYLYDPGRGRSDRVPIVFRSPRTQRARRFVDARRYLQGYALHPDGHSVALIVRGKPYTMGNWEGAVVQYGRSQGVRYRLATWLPDGIRLALLSDAGGEEAIEVHRLNESAPPERLDGLDIGRPIDLVPSPTTEQLALSNHRYELIVVNLASGTARVLDRSRYDRICGLAWAPDGQWLAYGFPTSPQTSIIKLCHVATGESWPITETVLRDVEPAFDPDGNYLYFLSYRDFDPVHDSLQFELSFPRGMRPYLITLRAELRSPFVPIPAPPKKPEEDGGEDAPGGKPGPSGSSPLASTPASPSGGREWPPDPAEVPPVTIDIEGITRRIVPFPVDEGRYSQVWGLRGKVLFSSYPVEGTLRQDDTDEGARGKLEVYDLEEREHEVLVDGISDFEVALDGETLIYRSDDRLRVLGAGKKPPEEETGDPNKPGRKTGWLDLERIRVMIDPAAEWAQMYREAWRLQRDQFWAPDMSGIDWPAIYARYLPLLERVGTRSEFSDLLWELQGELGTSHAFEMGGDYRPAPDYTQGMLGADVTYDASDGTYRVARIVSGDVWNEAASSPLARPGVSVAPGDRILAINGQPVGDGVSPQELLVNQAGNEVLIEFAGPEDREGGARRTYAIKTLNSETPARYRSWVETNRQRVHEATGGRAGYVHIPDMGENGYAEFHRGYLLEVEREGLIVDVRFNGGGYVSQLVLEKLARRRLAYDVQRWGEPIPYPVESVAGPLVALCNELAGSDGDMFAHAFKLMKLGPLIGKRTWGGVIGIEVRDTLVDGGITTQPEYSTWFRDVAYGVENYGTVPDIEVEITPQDYAAGRDPQLERAIAEVLRLMAEHPPLRPDMARSIGAEP